MRNIKRAPVTTYSEISQTSNVKFSFVEDDALALIELKYLKGDRVGIILMQLKATSRLPHTLIRLHILPRYLSSPLTNDRARHEYVYFPDYTLPRRLASFQPTSW